MEVATRTRMHQGKYRAMNSGPRNQGQVHDVSFSSILCFSYDCMIQQAVTGFKHCAPEPRRGAGDPAVGCWPGVAGAAGGGAISSRF